MTYDKDGWGPWIEHDGRGCPCVGMYAQVVFWYKIKKAPSHYVRISDKSLEGIVSRDPKGASGNSWDWRRGNPVERYRIRKPRGMEVLERAVRTEEQDA